MGFILTRGSPLVEVLESKYEVWRGLLREDTQSHSSLWWRDLKLVCDEGSPNKWFDRRPL